MKNYLWNMFANIKNGQISKRSYIYHTKKNLCESFLKILWNEGFILNYVVESNKLKIFLKYNNGKPAIKSIKTISKPSRRIYYSTKQLWKIDSSKSFTIISTNKGLKSLAECKKQRLGGEPYITIN